MSCPTNDIEIPNLIEPCNGVYYSTNCISIPEANVTLDLSIGASQTEVNDALTTALIYKEQQVQELQSEIDSLESRVSDLETEVEGIVVQSITIPNDTDVASALNEGKLRYYVSGNNSYLDICMKNSASTYEWSNVLQQNW